jgi:hypothetical protein
VQPDWEGYAEAPYKLGPHAVLGALARKVVRDPLLRGTLPNALRYLTRGDLGRRVLARLTREELLSRHQGGRVLSPGSAVPPGIAGGALGWL